MRKTLLALTVTATCFAAVGAYAADQGAPRAAQPESRPLSPVPAASEMMRANFEVFSSAPAEMTAVARRAVLEGPTPDLGANPDLAVHAGRDADGHSMWLVPADGWMCLAASDGTVACNTVSETLAGHLMSMRLTDDGRQLLRVVVPDQAAGLSADDENGRAPLSTTGNVASRAARTITSVRFTDRFGVENIVPAGGVPGSR